MSRLHAKPWPLMLPLMLQLQASSSAFPDPVQLLLSEAQDLAINALDEEGMSALHLAVVAKEEECIEASGLLGCRQGCLRSPSLH